MMRIPTLFALLCICSSCASFDQDTDWSNAQSFHEFHARDLAGEDVSLAKYRGHVTIVFNGSPRTCPIATKNFKALQALQERYPEDLRVVTFIVDSLVNPTGSSEDSLDFLRSINVSYDAYEKILVDGEEAHPVYKWIKSQLNNEKIFGSSKILIDRDGKVVVKFMPNAPMKDLEETMKQYF